jgi:hypothetical protein
VPDLTRCDILAEMCRRLVARRKFLIVGPFTVGVLVPQVRLSSGMAAGGKWDDLNRLLDLHRASLGSASSLAGLRYRKLEFTAEWAAGDHLETGVAAAEIGPDCFQFRMLWQKSESLVDGFRWDGESLRVVVNPENKVGEFASFAGRSEDYVRAGLLGGTLNPDWPLVSPGTESGKTAFRGRESIAGHPEAIAVEQKFGALEKAILYFDPESGRHLATRYRKSSRVTVRTRMYENWIEEFSVFEPFDGLFLPRIWKITHEMPRSRPQWILRLIKVVHSDGPELLRGL